MKKLTMAEAAKPQTEAQLHADVVKYLKQALPANAVFHHSPNEGKRGWIAQKSLKTYGTRAGWPDIEIIWGGRFYGIELKSKSGRVEETQMSVMKDITSAGAAWIVCRSKEEVELALNGWGIPLKARIAA